MTIKRRYRRLPTPLQCGVVLLVVLCSNVVTALLIALTVAAPAIGTILGIAITLVDVFGALYLVKLLLKGERYDYLYNPKNPRRTRRLPALDKDALPGKR